MGRVLVREELRDDGRLGDDLAVVRQGRDQAARVDLEILGGTRSIEVDDLFLEGDAKFGQSNVGTVSPCMRASGLIRTTAKNAEVAAGVVLGFRDECTYMGIGDWYKA